jgi:prevent-host-death family protein
VRTLSATDASRRFADVLDAVERDGETFVIERRGRAVASISPAPRASGRAVKEALRAYGADRGWSRELRELRASLTPEDRLWND